MKRYISILLTVFLLFSGMLTSIPQAHASAKLGESRAIAIVFDNSGSMYQSENQAWCRATYAMEVFASMLNKGDILQIYPMWPITIGDQTYTMENPFLVTDSAQASSIRDILTEDAGGTPIESIDCAANGLLAINADKKYMIVLTDGGTFSKNGSGLTKDRTRKELDKRIEQYTQTEMKIMYLGVGSDACMPNTAESERFIKKQAVDTSDVLSTLTMMCNQIFGRDTLPKNRISNNTINFDVSMSKLIVFVQGDNISNLGLTGGTIGKPVSTQQTKYSTKGAGDYKSVPDTSLQGMMVTYADCSAGTYTIEYTGTATSVEVYYEPDADLDFVFTDANGNTVDPNALYEGDYKVSFGMKDAKTGELISSDLLGQPKYQGNYYINGTAVPITHEGFNGSIEIPLKVGDTFKADLTVTYLSGYTISKDSSDFGWPDLGIQIAPRPAGELVLKVTGGEDIYYLRELEDGTSYNITAYYEGRKLNADEYTLCLSGNSGNTEPRLVPNGDHYDVFLKHSDPALPENTQVGSFEITANASYVPSGSTEANATVVWGYRIDAARPAGSLQMEIVGGQDVYSLPLLEEGKAFEARIYYEGTLLVGDLLKQVILKWDPDVSYAEVKYEFADDHYNLELFYKDVENPQNTTCGECIVPIFAYYTQSGCDESRAESSITYSISEDPYALELVLSVPEDYIVIGDLEESKEITVSLTLNGKPLTPEEFAATQVQVNCGGIDYTATPYPEKSEYQIKLLPTNGIEEGKYPIEVSARYTDTIGRVSQTESDASVTLGLLPLWLRWLIYLLILLALFIVLWIILHIKVLPKHLHTTRRLSSMNFDGDDVTQSTNFLAEIKKKGAKVQGQYGGKKFGVSMDVKPGKESYLYKPHKRRSAEVKVASVKKFGSAKIQEAMIGSAKYVADETGGKLIPALPNQKPFMLTNGMMVKFSGTIQDAGIDKDFEVTSKLNFKKK